jgi:DNA-binding NarL/FixJ family response regulator
MENIKLAIVDDHTLFRNGLKLLLSKSASNLIGDIFEATNGVEFLNLIENQNIDIVLMDISMPEMDGIEATEKALEKNSNLRIIALTMFNDDDYYLKMIQAGVKGFLLKESDIQEVVYVIKTVHQGNSFFPVDILCKLLKAKEQMIPDGEALSERELEILQLISEGLSNSEIAQKLYLSKRTVDKHRSNILMKTNCKNTANLVMYAVKNNLVRV